MQEIRGHKMYFTDLAKWTGMRAGHDKFQHDC